MKKIGIVFVLATFLVLGGILAVGQSWSANPVTGAVSIFFGDITLWNFTNSSKTLSPYQAVNINISGNYLVNGSPISGGGGSDTNETTRVDNIVGTSCSAGNFIFNFSTDGTPQCDASAGSGDITAVNTNGKYLDNGSVSGDVYLQVNESQLNATIIVITDERDDVGGAGGTNCNASGSCSAGGVAYLDYANTGSFNVSENISANYYKAETLGFTLTEATDDLSITSNVEGSNYLEIATTGAFLQLYGNPGPANDDLLFTIQETQGSTTEMNFYEGGTGNNRFWSSGSVRIGGGANSLCSNLTSDVDCDTSATGADLVVEDDIWSGGKIFATDWTDVSITESQISDLSHTIDTDTNFSGVSAGGDLSGTYPNPSVTDDSHNHVYSNIDAFTEANLYTILSDVSEFIETNDAATLTTLNTGQGANELYDMNQNVLTTSDVQFDNVTFENLIGDTDPANHHIFDNSTCIILRAGTTTLEVCE